ncbi:hypothetical protein DRQ25_04705 [Candidatus Fermentibacteria bacterium]|nr:MAG: hypothetical protein DRQ25_04705 [Candidatus Fermentibacteria bacterium]
MAQKGRDPERGKEEYLQRVVERLADSNELIHNFEDVRVMKKDGDSEFIAATDIEKRIVYLNPYSKIVSKAEYIKILDALLLHECLPADTVVSTDAGGEYITEIEKRLRKGERVFVKSVDIAKRSITNKEVMATHKREIDEKIYQVSTMSGASFNATGNHPILVADTVLGFSWKKIRDIRAGDILVKESGELGGMDRDKGEVILSEEAFIDRLPARNRINAYLERIQDSDKSDREIGEKYGITRNTICTYRHGEKPVAMGMIEDLKHEKLLPLVSNSERIYALARLVGSILANGWLLSTRHVVGFSGTYKADMELVMDDLKFLGRKYRYNAYNHSVVVERRAFYDYLLALGLPRGERVEQEVNVPEWIFRLDNRGKRCFLSGLFGGDGLKPSFRSNTGGVIRLKVSKTPRLESCVINYLTEIQTLLKECGIKSKVYKSREYETTGWGVVQKERKGNAKRRKRVQYCIEISNQRENLIRFLEKVGYAYSLKGKTLGGSALKYLQERKGMLEAGMQSNTIHNKVYTFDEYLLFNPTLSLDYKFDEVKDCSVRRYRGYVYNLTVADTHNYVANGIVVKNCGHLDSRLRVPATAEINKEIIDLCKDEEGNYSHDLLNIVFDMEIHFQYNIRGRAKVSHRRKLREMLTLLKSKLPPEDLLLCFEFQETEVQRGAKEIMSDRTIPVVEKYRRIYALLEEKGQIDEDGEVGEGLQSITDVVGGVGGGERDEGIGNGEGGGEKPSGEGGDSVSEASSLDEESTSIKGDIENKAKEKNIMSKLEGLGFSDAEINTLIEEKDVDDLLMIIEHLEKSFSRVLPDLYSREGKEKTREHIRGKGNRMNGFRKMRDIDEITENPEDLITVGQYDLEEIRIPQKVRRKNKSIVFILRDVSGSVSSEPLSRIMRDTTVAIIEIAKKRGCQIAVMDFSTDTHPIKDSRGKILTKEYGTILAKSMLFKTGTSTILSKALKRTDQIIEEEKQKENNINIFIITDSYIDNCNKTEMTAKKINMVGLCKYGVFGVDENLTNLVKKFRGEIYSLDAVEDKLVATLYDSFGGNCPH